MSERPSEFLIVLIFLWFYDCVHHCRTIKVLWYCWCTVQIWRWEDNIKMDLQEVGGDCGDWIELSQEKDRWQALVSTVRNLRVPKMRGISWLAAEPVSFSRRNLLHGVSKYNPRHVSSTTMLIFRRSNCDDTRCCDIQFVLVKMGMLMLEICRGL
jgi:hypothetical protein